MFVAISSWIKPLRSRQKYQSPINSTDSTTLQASTTSRYPRRWNQREDFSIMWSTPKNTLRLRISVPSKHSTVSGLVIGKDSANSGHRGWWPLLPPCPHLRFSRRFVTIITIPGSTNSLVSGLYILTYGALGSSAFMKGYHNSRGPSIGVPGLI